MKGREDDAREMVLTRGTGLNLVLVRTELSSGRARHELAQGNETNGEDTIAEGPGER